MADPLPKTSPVVFRIPDGSGGTEDIVVDACERENHVLQNTITDHAIEVGEDIADHSRPDPQRVTLDCVQSNTPPPGRADTSRPWTNPSNRTTDGTDHALTLWNVFVGLHKNPKLVGVNTTKGFYESMGIETVTSPVDAKTANALVFTIVLKKVNVVQNKFTQVVPTKDPKGQKKKDAGKASTKETSALGSDTAAKIGKAAVGLFGG